MSDPIAAELYVEGRPHITHGLSFAARVLVYLAKNHCFLDGNKRVAWTATMDVLATLGLSVNASTDEAFDFVDDILNDRIESGEQVAAWMAPRLFAVS